MLCGGSIGLQADTVTLASGMPLEFPAPPSLQILAIARYRCGLRLVWHENPSLLFVPPRMKHCTRTLMVGACTTSQLRGRYKQIRSHSQSPDGLLLATSTYVDVGGTVTQTGGTFANSGQLTLGADLLHTSSNPFMFACPVCSPGRFRRRELHCE